MFSLAEYERMDKDIIVEKLLVVVHQAISDEFPNAAGPSQQFKKTVFSAESTLMNPKPDVSANSKPDNVSNFKSSFDTSEFPSEISDVGDQMHSSFEQGVDTVTNSRLDQFPLKKESSGNRSVTGIILLVAFIILACVAAYFVI